MKMTKKEYGAAALRLSKLADSFMRRARTSEGAERQRLLGEERRTRKWARLSWEASQP